MTTPDPAVAAAIRRAGQDPDTARGRDRATPTRCPHCRAPILVGLDDDVAAIPAHVDPWPLTVRDEATAWLATPPRRTYRLDATGPRLRIRARDHWQITGTPPGPGCHVVAEHRCGQPLGDTTPPPPAHPEATTTGAPY